MMPRQTDRLSCKSPPFVRTMLILQYAVALLLLAHSNEGQSQAIGQTQSIVALVGNNITLPCHVKPVTDAVDQMLEWARPDLSPRFVHVRRASDDRLVDQNPSYKERTSVSIDRLKQGDASLTLSRVKLSDQGTYICFIPGLKTNSSVQLVVDDSDSDSTASIIIGLVVGVLVILVVALAVRKWRQNKIKSKKQQEDVETQRGGQKNSTSNDSEQQCLIERETDSEQSKKESQTINNQNTMEDKNNLARSGEGTKRAYQTEQETHQEKTEGETSNILIQGQKLCEIAEEESKSITVETATPGTAEVETQKEKAERTKSVNSGTATQSLMDGHGQQQQVRGAADANNDTEKEEKEEDIQSAKDKASSQGLTDDKRQHNEPTAGGGATNDSDQTGGQTGRSEDPPVPAERKQQQVRAAGEPSNDTNMVENKDQTQTTENEAAAQGPTDDKTQPSHPPAGGGKQNGSELISGQKDTPYTAESRHKVENGDGRDGGGNPTLLPPVKPDRLSKSEQKDLNTLVGQEASTDTKTVENKIQTQTNDDNAAAQGPTDDTTQHGDPPAGEETNVTEGKDTPCPAERRQIVKNGDGNDGGGNPTLFPPVKPDRLSKAEQQNDLNKKNEVNKTESTNNEAAGPTEGETQQYDGPAVGGTMNDLDQTGGTTGKNDDNPVPAEGKRLKEQPEGRETSLMQGDGHQQLVGQEASNDTKPVENKIQSQTKGNEAAAQGPTDDTTQHGDPPAGGETKITEEKEKTESTNNQAAGPSDGGTQKEQPERTKSVNTETATQSLMDGHGRQQQVRAAADANNDTEKEKKEEDIKSAKDKASSQGLTDDKRQHNEPTAGGGATNDSDQTGGQTGRSDDPPVPAERKQQQVRAAGEPSNDTNMVENKDQTQTTENEAAAQGPTDDKTQPSDPPAGGEKQNDSELITVSAPCPAERRQVVKNVGGKDGEGNPTLLSSVKPDLLHNTEEQRKLDQPQAEVESDVAKKERETDKTGLDKTREKPSVKDQPEKQEKGDGDGEEGTSSANSKREHHPDVNMCREETQNGVNKGKRRRKNHF